MGGAAGTRERRAKCLERLVGKPEVKRPPVRPTSKCSLILKWILNIVWQGEDWFYSSG